MTPEQLAFEAALKERLAERARILLGTDQAVLRQLVLAKAEVLQLLASQPSEFAQWQLTRVLDQVGTILDGATGRAATAADGGMRDAWQQGEDAVDKPLGVAGHQVEMRLPLLDVKVLQAMRTFVAGRFKDVGAVATSKINGALSRVLLGAQTPFQAIKAVQGILDSDNTMRATTIVRTEVSRAFALASQDRLVQAAELVPGLGKQWRRSRKIHSRWTHDLMDGQVVPVGQRFKVPNPGGGIDLMEGPHDPKAPAEQIINCGCIAIAHLAEWEVQTPGALAYSERELRLDGRKAALDRAAKAAGRRLEGGAAGSV